MRAKEWNKEHALKWTDSLNQTENQRTIFQERVLKELTNLLKNEGVSFNITVSEIGDSETESTAHQMIKVGITHECVKDSFIYANQLDFTSGDHTYHFEFWGYLDPELLIESFLTELKNKLNNCG